MKSCYPVCLFTYNRPEHTRRTVEALKKNTLAQQTDLYVFSDAPRTVEAEQGVAQNRAYLKTITGFKSVTVVEVDKNHGPFKIVAKAMQYMSTQAEAFIFVEDDIETHPFFLSYMNQALDFYRDNKKVAGVSGFTHEHCMDWALKHYPHDMVFSYAFHCFAWGTWRDRFENVDLSMPGVEEYLKSLKQRLRGCLYSWGHLHAASTAAKSTSELWDIRFGYYLMKKNLLFAWPRYTYASNFGFDGTGLHHYDFAANCFESSMQHATEHPRFTNEVDFSRMLHFKIEMAIGFKWVFAFSGNLNRILKKQVHKWNIFASK